MKALRTDRELECPRIDAGLAARGVRLVVLPDGVPEDELVREARDADLILMCYTPVTARVIEGAARLKGIVKYGVGIDAIDIAAAMRRRVPVVNVPEYAEDTVAEGAFALMIALAKKLQPMGRAMAAKGWLWPTSAWMGADLAGKTLGLVGVGRIGSRLAGMAAGFRMRILGYDPHVPAAVMAAKGVEKQGDLKLMLGQSDFVSIHAVLTPESRRLIGAAEFSAMKPTAFLINTARGALVDEAALLKALRDRRIGGAGLDVFAHEPLGPAHELAPLYGMENVILTPHLTFFTAEAMARLEEETLARCAEVLEGRPVLVKSRDPRLRAQTHGVVFAG